MINKNTNKFINKYINKLKTQNDLFFKNEIEVEKKYNEMYNCVINKNSKDIKNILLDRDNDTQVIHKNINLKVYNENIIYEYICPDYTIIIDE